MRKWLVCFLVIFVIAGCIKKKKTTSGDDGGTTGGTTSTVPGKSTLLTPAQNSICISGQTISTTQSNVTFVWTATANTDSYDLVIKNLLLGTSTTQSTNATRDTAMLLRNTPYSWYISSKQNGSSTTTQSDTWKFYNSGAGVVTYAPFPAELTAPAYGEIVTTTTGSVSLNWTGSAVDGNITSYTVYFGTTATPPIAQSGITSSYYIATVSHNTTYYWRVITLDTNGNYSDSGVYQFTVQ